MRCSTHRMIIISHPVYPVAKHQPRVWQRWGCKKCQRRGREADEKCAFPHPVSSLPPFPNLGLVGGGPDHSWRWPWPDERLHSNLCSNLQDFARALFQRGKLSLSYQCHALTFKVKASPVHRTLLLEECYRGGLGYNDSAEFINFHKYGRTMNCSGIMHDCKSKPSRG